jgi:hydroxyethylthiazole kinase-like uncharacterized protein yjeF
MSTQGLSLQKILELEAKAKTLGLTERLLIENASSNLAAVIHELSVGEKILVLAGRGNNGADSLAAARKLTAQGYKVTVCLIQEKELGPEASFQKEILEKIAVSMYRIDTTNVALLTRFLKNTDCILDGILGIGVKGEVSPFLKRVFRLINESGKTIIACDVPSGLLPDNGRLAGAAVRANYTITFIAAKRGFFMRKGARLCGKIITVDIGVSRSMLERL